MSDSDGAKPGPRGDETEDSGTAAPDVSSANAEPQAGHAVGADRNWMGWTALVTGALLLSVIAIVLGHVGLAAARRGRATNRGASIAGLILGYLGLLVTAAGAWLLFFSGPTPEQVDAHAQQDVSAVGAAAAQLAVETNALPDVAERDGGYTVGGQSITAALAAPRELVMVGEGPAGWCLEITYEGGAVGAYSYSATEGLAPGRC